MFKLRRVSICLQVIFFQILMKFSLCIVFENCLGLGLGLEGRPFAKCCEVVNEILVLRS
jgi:hypothetical protein